MVLTDGVLNKLFPNDYVAGKLPPDHLAAVSLATASMYSVFGGWVTARIASCKHWQHVFGLVVWGEIIGIVSLPATWGQIQLWYQIGLLVLWPVAVMTDGWIRAGKPLVRPVDLT